MDKMNASELVKRVLDIANNYRTLYVMGCFGAPLKGSNVQMYCTNHSYNRKSARTAMIKAAGNQNPTVFGFDCVCLIKAVMWGWTGDSAKSYGGAKYASNGIPDVGADKMITLCSGVSKDFSGIIPGEAVWLPGHIGVYVGNGLVVEASPAFANKVQITGLANLGKKPGYNMRTWTKHGKLPFIQYNEQVDAVTSAQPASPVPKVVNPYTAPPVVQEIYDFLTRNLKMTPEGAAGMLANIEAESDFRAENVQTIKGDEETVYRQQVDSLLREYPPEAVSTLIRDNKGIGLCQWTYPTRKSALFNLALERQTSVWDINLQLEYLALELNSTYRNSVLVPLQSATSATTAAVIVMTQFEKPSDMSELAQSLRAAKALGWYKMLISADETENRLTVGGTVYHTGNRVYTSSDAKAGYITNPGQVKILISRPGAQHSLNVRGVNGCNTEGWVDADLCATRTGTTTARLNLRNKPNIHSNSLGIMSKLSRVYIIAVDESGWYKVYSPELNAAGWCSNDYVNVKPVTAAPAESAV